VVEEKDTQAIPPVDVVYVEMTQSQLESVLADIADQPVYFSNIMVPANPAFAGQAMAPADGRLLENLQRQSTLPVAPSPDAEIAESTQSTPSDEDAQAEQRKSRIPPPSRQGFAQRLQLPQLSDSLNMERLDPTGTYGEAADKPASKRQKNGKFSGRGQEAGEENQRDAGMRAPDANERAGEEQMFRALFILRVVPPAVEAADPTVDPAAEETDNRDSEEP